MKKIKVGVLFGGKSSEHEVSILSACSVMKNLNKKKYEIYPIYIDLSGKWYKYEVSIEQMKTLEIGEYPKEIKLIENLLEYLKRVDIAFPVFHGKNGEDGNIQGFLEILGIPYVGCKVLSSGICMNKIYTKIMFEKAGINQASFIILNTIDKKGKYTYIDEELNFMPKKINEIDELIKNKLKYPVYVKPSNSGSSIGISVARNIKELKKCLNIASLYDKEILIEKAVIGRELECAVIELDDVKASVVGEILSSNNFYDYDAKYKNSSSKTIIPADLDNDLQEEIKKTAIKAFKIVGASGLSRVDFFLEKDSNKILINEINTMPGFTNISMYPKLWEKSGIKYKNLLDKLITIELKKWS